MNVDRAFLDTNVLVYAIDAGDARRRVIATATLREHPDAVVSTQVLSEFYVVATRKLGLPPGAARAAVNTIATREVALIDADTVIAAAELVERTSIGFWDALIVRTAIRANCTTLLTEDLQHGATIDGVRVVDPFTEG